MSPDQLGPRLLILETSGRAGQVALAQNDRLLRLRRLDEARRHARDLAPAVAELLQMENWRPRHVAAVVVSQGPGSYTGLRVGIMAAKAFAYATGAALIAVPTFEALAAQAPRDIRELDVIADAQQGKVYVQSFCRKASEGPPSAVAALRIQPLSEWLVGRNPQAWVTGPGLRDQQLPAHVSTIDPSLRDPQTASLLQLGLAQFRAGRRHDLMSVEPLYLRASGAEEQWARGPIR
jgi:tRNA threonylcarbamoyladenosine biosynthesis protein TsaB